MDLSATSPTLATLDDCSPRSQASQCSNPGYPKRKYSDRFQGLSFQQRLQHLDLSDDECDSTRVTPRIPSQSSSAVPRMRRLVGRIWRSNTPAKSSTMPATLAHSFVVNIDDHGAEPCKADFLNTCPYLYNALRWLPFREQVRLVMCTSLQVRGAFKL